MHTRALAVTTILMAPAGAMGFVARLPPTAGLRGRSAVFPKSNPTPPKFGMRRPEAARRRCRAVMSSIVPPQRERQDSLSVDDFDSWFWGDAHGKGGVEHAVFERADSAVVLFDGECNFCNSSVWMMIANSDARNMRFCAQNTEMGLSLLHSFGQDQERLSSIGLLDKDGHLHTRSSAVIEILFRMNMPFPALAVLIKAVPLPVRDAAYAWVSRNRHAFGTESQLCRIPEDDEVSRFLM